MANTRSRKTFVQNSRVEKGFQKKTDYGRWRLLDEAGRQTWHYIAEERVKEWPQSTADKYHLGIQTVRLTAA
jgi:hypothetical protein